MTTWFHLSPKASVLSTLWAPLLFPVLYWLMDKKHAGVPEATSHQKIPYSPLDSPAPGRQGQLTREEKARVIWYNMPLALSMYATNTSRYLLSQAIVTTIVFSNAPFSPRDHYQYYLLTSLVGETVGMSYGFFTEAGNCARPYTKHTWIFSTFNVLCLIFLVFASWFRFLHHVGIVIAICLAVGLSAGLVHCFTFEAAYGEPKSVSLEFSRSVLVAPISAGSLIASLLGLYVEPSLIEHCVYLTGNTAHCLTRVQR